MWGVLSEIGNAKKVTKLYADAKKDESFALAVFSEVSAIANEAKKCNSP